jgi:CRISPR/Cas system-associated exonuclease Cas4 (RecB family)
MNRSKSARALAHAGVLLGLFVADVSPDALFGVTLGRSAHAIVGIPVSPVSVAGVARRTTRRVVAVEATAATSAAATTSAQQKATAQQQAATAQQQAATAQQQQAVAQQQAATQQKAAPPAVGTVVSTLPLGCTQEAKGGVEYQKCGGVYYRVAFQGNNLVYVVQQP